MGAAGYRPLSPIHGRRSFKAKGQDSKHRGWEGEKPVRCFEIAQAFIACNTPDVSDSERHGCLRLQEVVQHLGMDHVASSEAAAPAAAGSSGGCGHQAS
ncbi:hypothetical protein MTO96_021256 [Rhipicephalus appendiculatus]